MSASPQGTPGRDVSDKGEQVAATRARALSSPLRWQVLRLCLIEPRTNKELADLLDVNPGSMLHHVRTLVSTGYLDAEAPRRGARNSLEIPYSATPLTAGVLAGASPLSGVMEQALNATGGTDGLWRETLYLDDQERRCLEERLREEVERFARESSRDVRGASHGARPWRLVTLHQAQATDAPEHP